MRVPQSTLDLILDQGGLPNAQTYQVQEMLVLVVSDLRDERNPTLGGDCSVYNVIRTALFDTLNAELRKRAALVIKDLSVESTGRQLELRVGVESPNGLWGSYKSFQIERLMSSIAEDFVNDYASARLKAKHLLDEPFPK